MKTILYRSEQCTAFTMALLIKVHLTSDCHDQCDDAIVVMMLIGTDAMIIMMIVLRIWE